MRQELVEIRWHGRGGQGAVTAAKTLAAASMREGKYFQAFPEYGPERRGAPLQAFTRLSDEPIRSFAQVKSPSIVVILDGSLIGGKQITDGLADGAIVVANYDGPAEDLCRKLNLKNVRVFAVNAKKIAMNTLGSPITNMPMVGALIKATGVVGLESALAEVKESFSHKFRPEIVEANLQALQVAYDETVEV